MEASKPDKVQKKEDQPAKDPTAKSRQYNLLVYVRLRPVLQSEFAKEIVITCNDDRKSLSIDTKSNLIVTKFDRVFNDKNAQIDVFTDVKHFIPAVLQGFNCTVFAYGQTGSGKTHTMFGSDWENMVVLNQNKVTKMQTTYIDNIDQDKTYSGIIPRMIFELFSEQKKEDYSKKSYTIYCSFLQIYNEKIFDLLQVTPTMESSFVKDKFGYKPLAIHENKYDGIYVDGLTEFCVNNYRDCLLLMQKGERNRFIRSTSSNIKSSRSHTIFQIIVETTKADGKGRLQKAKLNLCDLAGSEKLKKGEEIELDHLKELKNINLSLTTLGKVIHNLSMSQRLPIPYRESKLTRLLQDSLGGNTRTCYIATIRSYHRFSR